MSTSKQPLRLRERHTLCWTDHGCLNLLVGSWPFWPARALFFQISGLNGSPQQWRARPCRDASFAMCFSSLITGVSSHAGVGGMVLMPGVKHRPLPFHWPCFSSILTLFLLNLFSYSLKFNLFFFPLRMWFVKFPPMGCSHLEIPLTEPLYPWLLWFLCIW